MSNLKIDEDEVSRIVETMKRKYREEGIVVEDVDSSLKEIRGIIADNSYSKIDLENEEDLELFGSDLSKKMGNVYLKFKRILKPIQKMLKDFPLNEEIGYYLYSANMRYSANQYLALASAVGFIATLFSFIVLLLIGIILKDILFMTIIPIFLSIFIGFIAAIIMIHQPKQIAVARGNAISTDLPFALRHMATELKAGIGLYKTIQAIAQNDYGLLSEEFARTINEIEEGADTTIALKHLSLRTQSQPLKKAVNHILRAMRIGGNLSNSMNEIASDVSEELRVKINSFAQQMNFFSVIFIFIGIVLPVAIMILGSIRNSPLAQTGQNLFKAIPLTPEIMFIMFVIIMPALFAGMIFGIYSAQPKM
jgi:pilus assembly protein TadC